MVIDRKRRVNRIPAPLLAFLLCLPALAGAAQSSPSRSKDTPSLAKILSESKPSEWHRPDPESLLVMRLASGRIVMELDPTYAPLHVANIRTLVSIQTLVFPMRVFSNRNFKGG